jgi:prolyl-tRNA editing enzyme YbaK/EbsC (Cys-tRNA(Pro) deacylase)
MPELMPLARTFDVANDHPAIASIATWAREYLCRPHPDLGRNGPMCPFVPGALQKQLLFVAVHERGDLDLEALKQIMLDEMERFIRLEPTSGNDAQFKALMVLFPNLSASDTARVIDIAQSELQEHFVPNGLMVGEFHAGPPQKGGLWNADFRPLFSPVPMLAIRHMVPTDILFLKDNQMLFSAYNRIYGNSVPERFRAHYDEAASRFGTTSTPADANSQAAPRVIEALKAADTAYRVHCHDDFEQSIRCPDDFARALGYSLDRISKTLFLKIRNSDRYCMLICGMDKRVDLRKVSVLLDSGRLELASLTDLHEHVGYPPTSVTPIAIGDIPVYIDEALMRQPTVLTGSGVPRVEIEIAPADLQALCGARLLAMA